MRPLFSFAGAGVRHGSTLALHSVTLTIGAGEFVAIGGPNGAGKSTMLSLMSGLAFPTEGSCLFLDREVKRWPRQEFAQKVAVVTQSEPIAFPFSAGEVVAMGRMPYANTFFESATDKAAIRRAMEQTGTTRFFDRDFRTLSGGEKQRVLLASALAQEPSVLLLDEPSTHLDLHHQIVLHQLLQQLKANGMLIVAVTHDLNLAATYADRLLLIERGEVKADGTPLEVLTPEMVRGVFGVAAEVGILSSGKPWFSYGPLND